jgi:hypothetical protein
MAKSVVFESRNQPADLIDLDRYPILELAALPARELIARCRRELADVGALALPGFLKPRVTEALAAEAGALASLSYDVREEHTVYFKPADPSFPEGHPRRRLIHSNKGGVSYDHIPGDAILRRLYEWDVLMAFIAAALGEKRLYRHADPLAALNVNVAREGQILNWHFDRTDFSATLSLQSAEAGGTFEYLPWLRNEADQNYAGIARVIDGAREGVRTLPFDAGTLALFRGHHSLHRVTPTRGQRDRLVAVLSYVRAPGVTFTPGARQLFYGHSEPGAPARR